MRLGRKNLLYSMALAGVMMVFLVGYFIYMLPSLYVEHMMEQNLKSIYEQHKAYVETGSYENVRVKNVTACFSMEIPLEGDCIFVAGKAFSAEIILKDRRLGEILDSFREKLEKYGIPGGKAAEGGRPKADSGERKSAAARPAEGPGKESAAAARAAKGPGKESAAAVRPAEGPGKESAAAARPAEGPGERKPAAAARSKDESREKWDPVLSAEMEALEHVLKETLSDADTFPVEVRLLSNNGVAEDFFNESMKVHTYSGDIIIMEASVEDANNRFANYMAMEQTKDSIVVSYLPVVAPDADEIRPVVLQSLPMLGAVILLLVLLFSRMYSGGIVGPILRLVRHAEEMERTPNVTVGRMSDEWPDRKDEVRELADTLDDFYMQIKDSYRKLEEKNRELEEENCRQEIFLRASSHQLKTPVAAALLLVDGMINEIGRYRETKIYLPKVKEQLLSMRRIVEEILYLNRCAENRELQQTDVGGLTVRRLHAYQVELADRGISAVVSGEESFSLNTDEMMIDQILDNLLSNAVKYTPRDGSIKIKLTACNAEGKAEVRIENAGAAIDEELLPHIYEPFVRGCHEGGPSPDSHGLGLYIASYYAKKLGITLSVQNGENCVISVLIFPDGAIVRDNISHIL